MKKEPAFPHNLVVIDGNVTTEQVAVSGLSKRDYFAAMAMNGLIQRDHAITDLQCAIKAVRFAEELVKELEKQ